MLPNRQRSLMPVLMLAPALLLIAVFILYPLVKAFFYSFEQYVLTAPNQRAFIGLDNFAALADDADFYLSLKNTTIWVLGSLAGQFILGFALALLLEKHFRGRTLYRAVVFSPWAISGFLIAVMWKWLLNPQYGPVNQLLLGAGLMETPIAFYRTRFCPAFGDCRQRLVRHSLFAIMLGAGLASIPRELYQAAAIDGAGALQRFVNITVPAMLPVIFAALLLRSIWIFNFADLIWVMTNGGPANKSQILVTYLFTTAYKNLNFGYAGALSVTIFCCWLLALGRFSCSIASFQ